MAGTIIGHGITIEGEITSDEEVVVAGTVRGKLSVEGSVTIDPGARVAVRLETEFELDF
ncbi:MAG: polymer-forming cytoskeletal protein [Myxococcales bacterium]|nr:polymer-forming cytoskeletal protein [Myxococcales bacterium]